MYSLQNIQVQFSGKPLFRQISFLINEKDRIGLVGRNGAGKTTLLKVIMGLQPVESGSVVIPEGKTLGYLPQEMEVSDVRSIKEEALMAFEEINRLKKEIDRLTAFISRNKDYHSAEYLQKLERLSHCNERLLILDGGNSEGEAEKVLLGLGFKRTQLDEPTATLSGGWRMRVELAKIILRKPDLLLLDEPTNHLDISSIQWLEDFLSSYFGAVVLISHDRHFLDAVSNRTIEISLGRIKDYKVPYSQYVTLRREEQRQQEAAYLNQQKQIKEIEQFIERFRYKATKARQVQSRVKMLEKMERIALDESDSSAMHFRFPEAKPSGKVVVEIKNYGKSYGEKKVLQGVNFVVLKNDFVAFVGKNGEGKSTLIKSIIGDIDYEGEIKLGYNVSLGYYGQNQAEILDENKTVFQTIDDAAVGDIRKNVRTILGSFLFGEDDLDKKVKVLSGGEKARLALAGMLLKPVNLLILDEPTNHLDMLSKDILKNALLRYHGTLILVSHDRDFLSGLSDITYEFIDGQIKEYRGGVELFLEKKARMTIDQPLSKPVLSKEKNRTSENKQAWLKKKEQEKQRRKLEKQLLTVEQEVKSLEERLEEMKVRMGNPRAYDIDLSDGIFFQQYQNLEKDLEKAMQQWEDLAMKLEE